MATRLRNCDETIVRGRLAKAEQFLDAAATVRDFSDAPDELAPPCLLLDSHGHDLNPGHSHDNVVDAFPGPSGPGGFWSIRVAAEADWPQQSRLLQVFDNHDGTLSIFGTILDHVGQAAAPAPGTPASSMDLNDLASAARTMSFNDFQSGAPLGEGQPKDRNVELLIDDPR